MAYMTFTDALMQAKRASQLRGTPFGTRDVMNLHSGYMEGAGERAAGERSAALAEKSLSAQETNWASTLAQEKELAGLSRTQSQEQTQAQIDAANTAGNKQLTGNLISTGATLGGAAYLMKPAAAGAKVLGGEGMGLTSGGALGPGGGGAWSTVAPYAVPAALTYAGAKGVSMLDKTKEVPKELVQAGKFVSDIFEAPLKAISGGCIIITACTDRHSPEVEIAREYRDKFMTPEELRGYYMLASVIVPILERNKTIRLMVKRWLVDRLVDYGKVVLGKRTTTILTGSRLVSGLFLMLCRTVGKTRKRFVRSNKEVC